MPAECCVKTLKKMLKPEHADEPVFLLLARDKTAPETIEGWITLAEEAGAPLAKLELARQHLGDFVAWQDAHPERVKVPD